MAPSTRSTAATPAQEAQIPTEIVRTREHTAPESSRENTASPPRQREEEEPITRAEVRAIAYEAAELAVTNVLRRLNLMPTHEPTHEPTRHPYAPRPMPIHEPEPEPIRQPYRPMPMATHEPTPEPTREPYTPRPPMEPMPQSYTRTEAMKPKDIGYFEPKPYSELTISDTEHGPVIHDVFLFTNRIRELSTRIIGRSMPIELSLRGTALEWFHSELSPAERSKLHSISAWCEALITRFGPTTGEAMAAITSERYTRDDAAKSREPAGYIQAIIRHGKAAALPMQSILAIAYQNIDPGLRRDLAEPESTSSFIAAMHSKKAIWFELYANRRHTPYPMNHVNQPRRYSPMQTNQMNQPP